MPRVLTLQPQSDQPRTLAPMANPIIDHIENPETPLEQKSTAMNLLIHHAEKQKADSGSFLSAIRETAGQIAESAPLKMLADPGGREEKTKTLLQTIAAASQTQRPLDEDRSGFLASMAKGIAASYLSTAVTLPQAVLKEAEGRTPFETLRESLRFIAGTGDRAPVAYIPHIGDVKLGLSEQLPEQVGQQLENLLNIYLPGGIEGVGKQLLRGRFGQAIAQGAKTGFRLGAVGGAAAGLQEEEPDAAETLVKTGMGAGAGAVVGAAGGVLGLGTSSLLKVLTTPSEERLLTSAIIPTKTIEPKAWSRALKTTITELADKAGFIKDLKSFYENIIARKKEIWGEVEKQLEKADIKKLVIDGNKVADTMLKVLGENKKIARENPVLLEKLVAFTELYRGKIGVQEAEDIIERTNAEMDAYYSKTNVGRATAEKADPEIETRLTLLAEMRNQLNKTMESLGENFAGLKKSYGGLATVGAEVRGRMMVAGRSALTSLAERISFAEAVGRGIASGKPLSGVAEALFAKIIKHLDTSDVKVERAFGKIEAGTAGESLLDAARKKLPLGLTIEDVSRKKFEGFPDLTARFLDYAKGKTTLSKQEILDFARRPELKKGEADLLNKLGQQVEGKIPAQEFADSVKAELLPLKSVKVKDPQYRSRTIDFQRHTASDEPLSVYKGNKNYEEAVFESPIATDGSSHYYPNSKNYFAHARGDEVVEDGKKIWREQEIQSDLLQKDKLENAAKGQPTYLSQEEGKRYIELLKRAYSSNFLSSQEKIEFQELAKKADENWTKNYNQLLPFTNDRFGERIMRERIKEKTKAGYEKYRLPTGKTIGEIEGFLLRGEFDNLTPQNTRVGMSIGRSRIGYPEDEWIITGILGDGRFRAVPKKTIDRMEERLSKFGSSPEDAIEALKKGDKEAKKIIEGAYSAETFDLTGKFNPQYSRYEKWGKFLKNKYGGKFVTDPQGNTWVEIDLKKEYGKLPIEAFAAIPLSAKTSSKDKK